MLPLYLLTNAKGQQLRIELKSGEIIEGELTNVDNWMNLTLSNVTEFKSSESTSQLEVLKSSEIYLKGIYIKYIKLQDDIISTVKQQINSNNNNNNNRDNNKNFRKYNNTNTRYNNRDQGGMGNRRNNYNNNNNNNSNSNNNNINNRRYSNNPNNRRPYNNKNGQNQMRTSNDGIGGYVQHHIGNFNGDNDSTNVEF